MSVWITDWILGSYQHQDLAGSTSSSPRCPSTPLGTEVRLNKLYLPLPLEVPSSVLTLHWWEHAMKKNGTFLILSSHL